jgi:hypothetical protein
MEESTMTSRTATNTTHHTGDAGYPEEEAILARFWTRVSTGAHKAAEALSHGSFLVL